jgi:hypothetical protein
MRFFLKAVAICGFFFGTQLAVAQDGPGTKFRGLYINMTKTEAEAGLSKEYSFSTDKEGYMSIRFLDEKKRNPKDSDDICAAAHFDSSNRIDTLSLWPCFFNAADMSFDTFIQEVSKSYSFPKLNCTLEPPDPVDVELYRQSQGLLGSRPTMTRRCKGFTSLGELIDFTSGALMVSRRTQAQRPTFN